MQNITREEAIKKLDAIEKEQKELRKIIEQPIEIVDRIQNYNDIMSMSGTSESDDKVNIKGFDESENKVISALIKKMRICKVYNEGERIKRNEKRWYSWYNVSSGFAFGNSGCHYSGASAGSASRLCLKNEKLLEDFTKKFQYIDEQIIDIQY